MKKIVLILFIGFSGTAMVRAQDQLVEAFRQSYELEAAGDFRTAANQLLQVYQPDSYEINLRLGWLFYQAGAFDESESYYRRAVALRPYAIEPRFGLAYPLSARAKWDEILAIYSGILETDPHNTIANYRAGLIWYNRGQYERAEAYLEKVINLYPFDYDTLLLFAWNKLAMNKSREAQVLFQKVLLYNPGDVSALQGLDLLR